MSDGKILKYVNHAPTWADRWVSVRDSLPPNENKILMTDGQQIALGWMNQSKKEFIQINTWENLTATITHWMPAPSPPQEETKND